MGKPALAVVADGNEVSTTARDRLRSLVSRIERLNEERAALSGDVKDIYAEAKSAGFNVRVLRALIRLRTRERAEVEADEAEMDLYRDHLDG